MTNDDYRKLLMTTNDQKDYQPMIKKTIKKTIEKTIKNIKKTIEKTFKKTIKKTIKNCQRHNGPEGWVP